MYDKRQIMLKRLLKVYMSTKHLKQDQKCLSVINLPEEYLEERKGRKL
jgi:hypothetical protein